MAHLTTSRLIVQRLSCLARKFQKPALLSHNFVQQNRVVSFSDRKIHDQSLLTATKNLKSASIFAIKSRNFGGKPPYTIQTVNDRVMLVLRLYDKINVDKLTLDSHFFNDLGLDSLDHVELIMQLEDEFTSEIPDGDAETLMTPRQIIQYILDKEDVYE